MGALAGRKGDTKEVALPLSPSGPVKQPPRLLWSMGAVLVRDSLVLAPRPPHCWPSRYGMSPDRPVRPADATAPQLRLRAKLRVSAEESPFPDLDFSTQSGPGSP